MRWMEAGGRLGDPVTLAALLQHRIRAVGTRWSIANYAIRRFFPAYMAAGVSRHSADCFIARVGLLERLYDHCWTRTVVAGNQHGSVGAVVAVWLGYFGLDVANIRSFVHRRARHIDCGVELYGMLAGDHSLSEG